MDPTTTSNTTGGEEPLNGRVGQGTAQKPFDQGNTTGEPSNVSTTNPSSSSARAPHQKQQGADRPLEDPQPGAQTDAIRATKDNAERAMDPPSSSSADNTGAGEGQGDGDEQPTIKRDPNDHSGEPMRDHVHDEVASNTAAGGDGNDGDGKSEAERKEDLGTGKKWVKSTGVAAEGGDFDAAQPGAAREADRILEEKGVHRANAEGDSATSKDPFDPANHPTVGTKIKDALHMGHKSGD